MFVKGIFFVICIHVLRVCIVKCLGKPWAITVACRVLYFQEVHQLCHLGSGASQQVKQHNGTPGLLTLLTLAL